MFGVLGGLNNGDREAGTGSKSECRSEQTKNDETRGLSTPADPHWRSRGGKDELVGEVHRGSIRRELQVYCW